MEQFNESLSTKAFSPPHLSTAHSSQNSTLSCSDALLQALKIVGPARSDQQIHLWQSAHNFLPSGFPHAALHEFVLHETAGIPYLPISFIIAGIWQATKTFRSSKKITVWIGRDRWPTPYALPQELRAHAYFLNPRSEKQFLWTLDAALRSPAVAAVVTHLERIPFPLSQRFALAARSSGALGIITRPYKSLSTPSAAPFRWEVASIPTTKQQPRWNVTLHKAKQALPISNKWIIDYEVQTFSLRIPTELGDRRNEESSFKKSGTFN